MMPEKVSKGVWGSPDAYFVPSKEMFYFCREEAQHVILHHHSCQPAMCCEINAKMQSADVITISA